MVGYSANTISLLGLVLAIGIVVDDAIVVVENVERVMEEQPDLTPAEATKQAMSEITAPIIAITLVLLSVFVPVAFIPGLSGVLFRQFAVTISAAMVISAINALTLSPALCAAVPAAYRAEARAHRVRPARHRQGAERLCRGGRSGWCASPSCRWPSPPGWPARSSPSARSTPQGFLPQEDQGAFFVQVQLPQAASLSRTQAAVEQVEAILKDIPAVENVLSIVGFSLIDGGSQSNSAFIVARLQALRGPHRGAGFASTPRSAGCSAPGSRCGPRRWSPSTCRRSSASAPAAASSTSCRTCRAATRRSLAAPCSG